MSKKLFSVILPSHNGAERIRTMLESIRSQSFTSYELIVVCDSCTDDTEKIAEEYHADKIITTDVHRDGLARNAGIDAAEGEWILFADDDDRYLHEYCFEQLAEKAKESASDVIDFGFVWKNEGYKFPHPDKCFVMVWCRAWRRSFIGDNRFSGDEYGSDVKFYKHMIQDNMSAVIDLWNMPMYYYNYMREGSMSAVEKTHTYLDIVVTHHDEPWELGKPFFDMLEHQRCVDMDRVCVTLVQDGNENTLPWDELFHGYRFPTNVITMKEHLGVADSRNAAIYTSKSDWIMFCNFDDMLADVDSLSMMISNFPNDETDVIWCKMMQECKWFTGIIYMNSVDGVNFSNTDAKMYRRQFLIDNKIMFDKDAGYYYDHVFNAIVLATVEPWRIRTLTTDFFPYCKTFRKDSWRHTLSACKEIMNTAVHRDILIAENLRDRNLTHEFRRTVAKVFCREYYAVYTDSKNNNTSSPEFDDFFRRYYDEFRQLPDVDIDPIRSEAEIEVYNLIQNVYNEHKLEYYILNEETTFEEWLAEKEKLITDTPAVVHDEDKDDFIPVEATISDHDEHEPRIVVYCGTYDVYLNMVASAKSVLCNTAVDKIYFLTEDDEFPYEIPDIIETINVKDQKCFPHDGPNFDNSWTWMCMMRATYPELFKQYSKVLSLDIDIVFNDDVSDLWDYDISDYYLAGVPERQRQKSSSDPLYINFGVVMMNLDKLREDGLQYQIIDILNTTHVDCPEQGAFNRVCAGHILELPADYNYTTYSHITGDAVKQRIIHYAGQKFWRHYALVKRYSDLSWDEVMERQARLHE